MVLQKGGVVIANRMLPGTFGPWFTMMTKTVSDEESLNTPPSAICPAKVALPEPPTTTPANASAGGGKSLIDTQAE